MKFSKLLRLCLALSTFLVMWMMAGNAHASMKSCHRGFVVFAGQDKIGKVVLAIENTQSLGDRWDWMQAAHAAWLYDERHGWIKLKHPYGNPFQRERGKRLGGEWEYAFSTGYQPKMSLHSDENGIHLNVKADKVAFRFKDRDGQVLVANGEGALDWNGRKVDGKVYLRDDLHLGKGASDLYFQNAKGMYREALYLSIGNKGMMSAVRTNGKDYAPLAGELGLSMMLDSVLGNAESLEFEATAWKRMGLYEYPCEWQGSFTIDGKPAMFKLSSFSFQTSEYLLFAGTRFAWSRGFLLFDGRTYPLYGFSEVEGRFQGKKQIQESEWRTKPLREITPGTSWEAYVH